MTGRLFDDALSVSLSRRFFSFKADEPMTDAPDELGMSRADWESFTPGMRREISRSFEPKPSPADPSPVPHDRTAEVELAGHLRL